MRATKWIVIAAVIAAACGRLDPTEELAAARASLATGDVRTARVHLSNVLQVEPDNVEAHALRGRSALSLDDYSSAVRDFDRARALGAAFDTIALDRAAALAGTGDTARALETLDKASDALSDEHAYWVVRAEVLIQSGSLPGAIQALDRAAAAGGETPRYLVARGRVAQAANAFADAEKFFSAAVATAPDDADAHAALGEVRAAVGRFDEAAAELAKAADLYGGRGHAARESAALFGLVQVSLAANDVDSAAAAADRLARRSPRAALTSYARGLVDYRSGRFDVAATRLQEAVNQQPDNQQFVTLLGAIQLARGNLGQAEQNLLRALSIAPRDPAAAKLLAETRLRQQRPEAALDALRLLADAGAQDPHVGLLTGLANLLAGNSEQGLLYLEQAAALDPGDSLLKLELARAYAAQGRTDEARDLLNAGLGANAEHGDLEARFMQLLTFARTGDTNGGREAVAALEAAFPRDPRALTAAAMYHELVNERQRARELLETAVGLDGRFVAARTLLASALVQEGRERDAEEQLRQVLAVDADNAAATTGLAQLAAARNDLAEAEALLRKTAGRTSATAPRLMLARLYIGQGRLADARVQVEDAAASAPNDVEAAATGGLLALAEGRAADAVELLRDADARMPNRLDVVLALADAQLRNGEPEDARASLRRVLAVAPRSLPLRVALGVTELRLGNAEEALTIAKALQVEFPSESEGYLLEGEVDIAWRRYEAAAASMRLAYKQQATWPVLNRVLESLQLAEHADLAIAALEGWVNSHADDESARLVLASLLQSAGRNADALTHYERVLAADGDNIVALNNAAWLYQRAGDPRALSLAERVHALAPESAPVLDTLAIVLMGQNRDRDAIAYLERATELAPRAFEIRYHLAQLQLRLARVDQARATLLALLRDGGQFEQRAAAQQLLESL